MTLDTKSTDKRPPFDGSNLQEPPSLMSLGVFGATAAFTALAIGSGELMFWPALVVASGAGVIWIALTVVALQWFVNIEVARFSVATGQTVGAGLAKRAPIVAFVLLLGALVPWIWPGWIRAGGQMLAALNGGDERYISLLLLILCASFLLVPRSAYLFIERIQSWMLGAILVGIAWLFGVVAFSAGGFGAFVDQFLTFKGAGDAVRNVASQDNAAYFALLSGVVFAGAGGILNLGYGYLVMARNEARSARSNEPMRDGPQPDDAQLAVWSRWIKVLRLEHGILFAGGNMASIFFLSALFFMLYRGAGPGVSGINLLASTYKLIGIRYGVFNSALFGIVSFLIFFTSSIGILDITCRVASDIFKGLFGVTTIRRWSVFSMFVVCQSVLSAILVLFDPRQPFWLISTSAVLNTLVMGIYAFAVIWLNRTVLDPRARGSLLSEAVVLLLGVLYMSVFIFTVGRFFA